MRFLKYSPYAVRERERERKKEREREREREVWVYVRRERETSGSIFSAPDIIFSTGEENIILGW